MRAGERAMGERWGGGTRRFLPFSALFFELGLELALPRFFFAGEGGAEVGDGGLKFGNFGTEFLGEFRLR